MDKIKELFYKIKETPLYTFITGLVIGLIIGLPVLGWGLFPVKWTDADPSYLRADLKKQYLCMVVDSYAVNRNLTLAAERLTVMGIEDLSNTKGVFKDLQEGGCSYASDDPVIRELKNGLKSIAPATDVVEPAVVAEQATQIPLPQETPSKEKTGIGKILLFLLLALLLLIGGALVYIFFIRNSRNLDSVPPAVGEEGEYIEEEEAGIYYEPERTDDLLDEEAVAPIVSQEDFVRPAFVTEPAYVAPSAAVPETPVTPAPVVPVPTARTFAGEPVAHFMTNYVIGDDLYDDSFSIDAPNGAFLGECGVGISDTIGVGDPKKVTAFEVWLFDKNDIQTVTKVLMSSHAMNDAAIKQRLASKGEPVLLEPGQQLLLETATLQLEAKVVEMVYGQGALPSGSFVERLTLELSVWPK